jgi:hypothetical protein
MLLLRTVRALVTAEDCENRREIESASGRAEG